MNSGSAGGRVGAPRSTAYIPRQMVTVVLPTTAVIMGDSLMYIVLPASVADFGLEDSFGVSAAVWIGLALSINRLIRLVGNSLAAESYRRFGFKTPFVTAVLVGGLTTLTYAFSQGAALLLLARAIWGLSYSHLRLGAYLAAFEVGDSSNRGRLLGFFNAGQRTGSFIAVTAGAALADATGRGTTFTVLAAAGVIGVLIALAAPDFKVRRVGAIPAGPASDPEKRARFGERAWDALVSPLPASARVIRRRLLAINYLRFGAAFAANGLVIATISPFLADLYGEEATVFGASVGIVTLAGFLVGVRWFGDLALAVPMGHLSDVWGRRRTVLVGSALTLGAMLVVGFANQAEVIVAALPLLLITGSLLAVALDASAGDAVPDEARAGSMARYATWLDMGSALGPIAGLLIADAYGFQAGFLIASALLITGIITYTLATRNRSAASGTWRTG
ncbi:MAG: MFS transporter [Chloroflexi bacterium]|nr:MFS transporter [Chloroflexota bacterium]